MVIAEFAQNGKTRKPAAPHNPLRVKQFFR
jgi:hypothetical protein